MGNSRHDLSIPKDYFMKDKAKLLYVSSSTYGGDWISTPHTHYCSELFYVLDGVGQFQVEDRIFPVIRKRSRHYQSKRFPYRAWLSCKSA